MPHQSPLEPDAVTARAWLDAAGELALTRLAGAGIESSWPASEASEAARAGPAIGEGPMAGGMAAVLGVVESEARSALVTTAPGYLAYIPGGGLFATAVASFIGDILNRYTGLAAGAPGLVRLENDVLAWLAAQFGYGPKAAGLFTSGGSLATFTAVVAARERGMGLAGDLRCAAAYTSSQAHASVAGAFRLAGLRPENLRSVPVDHAFRMRPDRLAEMVREDRARGLTPIMVVAAAGTTNTGAVDPLAEIAALCAAEGLWLHVDGAYGGAFVLCEEGRRRLGGVDLADSITFDPHKGMFLPYGTGCLLFRDGVPKAEASGGDESYLRDVRSQDPSDAGPSPADFGLELSRPYRGLRLWAPLMLHGAAPFREALTEKLALATALHRGLKALADDGLPMEIVAEPQLTVVPFRLARLGGEAVSQWNARNAAFLEAVNRRGRCFLSSTLLPTTDGEALTLRACVLSHRTHRLQINQCLEDIASAVAEVG